MNIFYKPAYFYLFTDLFILATWILAILLWFPFTTQNPFDKYAIPALFYILTWFVLSYLTGRYIPLRKQFHSHSRAILLLTSTGVLVIFQSLIFIFILKNYSNTLLYAVTAGEFSFNYLLLAIYFSYRHATEYPEIISQQKNTIIFATGDQSNFANEKAMNELTVRIEQYCGIRTVQFIKNNIDIRPEKTFVYASKDPDVLQYISDNHLSCIVQLQGLNGIRGINKMLSEANQHLATGGTFVCRFETKSTYKKDKLCRYPLGINYLFYSLDFILKRVFPKLRISGWFYFIFNGCKNRILSKAEVLGRLYACGFSVLNVQKIGRQTYVIAQRIKEPEIRTRRLYGALIRLKRYGKDGKPFEVYKMRTMHPYSEYLQSYIYEHHQLQEGGKFNKDIRVTTLGRYMRKYWLDEIPMIINLLKGEMKLVGVRPLSAQYFKLYKPELQEKRIKFKPGLLPPFYADMPKTLTEIQQSEMNYLVRCENNGVFRTDLYYLLLIMKNILFKKAHSA